MACEDRNCLIREELSDSASVPGDNPVDRVDDLAPGADELDREHCNPAWIPLRRLGALDSELGIVRDDHSLERAQLLARLEPQASSISSRLVSW